MIDERVYWVWLQQTLKYGNHKIRTIMRLYESVEEFYYTTDHDRKLCGCFTRSELAAFESYRLEQAEAIVAQCDALGYHILTLSAEEYPRRLKNIENPPCVLYCKGTLPEIDELPCISIVGTRSATQRGIKAAYSFAFELTQAGILVISGGALGIDCASHRGALHAKGKTVSILGCGIHYPYLSENIPLRQVIANNGALLSEYPPDCPPLPRNFPIRNRIIAGLSVGTLVIEAGAKSGSLITANLAAEQGRDVFAVPGDINIPTADGTNYLIKDGAKPVTCAEDILEEYRDSFPGKLLSAKTNSHPQKRENQLDFLDQINNFASSTYNDGKKSRDTKKKTKSLPKELSKQALTVYQALTDQPKQVDEFSEELKVPASTVLQAITELELFHLIHSLSGKRYCLPK